MQRFRAAKKQRKEEPTRSAATPLPVLDLPPQDQWRTSLILPHLASRFALLRDEDGSLVSLETMQVALRAQRQEGKLTADEERAVLHEFRVQTGKEQGPGSFSRDLRSLPRDEMQPPQTLDEFHRSRIGGGKGLFSNTRVVPHRKRSHGPSSSVSSTRSTSLPDLNAADLREEPDLTSSQIRRISRVLDVIEGQLSATHRRVDEPILVADENTPPRTSSKPRRPALRTNNSGNLAVVSAAMPRSASAQGSIHESIEELSLPRTPTPASTGDEAKTQRQTLDLASDTSSSPSWSPFAHRFPHVPPARDEDVTASQGSVSHISPAHRGSVISNGSSFESEEEIENDFDFDGGPSKRRRREPFEYDDTSPPDPRPSIDQLYEEALSGITFSDVAAIQEMLVQTANARASAALGRPLLPRTRSSSSASVNSRLGASTPASQTSRLDDVEEIEDEFDEELDTPQLDSATHSPSASSHDAHSVLTPPIISPSNSQHGFLKQKQPALPSTPPSVPRSPELPLNTSSRAAISNPAYKPGRPFPTRSTSTSAASSPLQTPPHLPLSQQVAAQATAATEALKQSPLSPNQSLRRSKSSKGLKASIGAPQLMSTSANLSDSAVRDLPKPTSPPPVPLIDPRHQRTKSGSSSGSSLRSKMLRKGGRAAATADDITPFELPPLPLAGSPVVNAERGTPKTPSTGFNSPSLDSHSPRSSPAQLTSPASQSSLHRMLTRLRKGKGSETSSPRSPPIISSPVAINGHSPSSSISTKPLPAAAAMYGLGLSGSENEPSRYQAMHPAGIPAYPPTEQPKSQRDSESSIRQLMQAAAELGIDSDKVTDLLKNAADPTATVVRRTIIVAAEESPAAIVLQSPPLRGRRRSEASSGRRTREHSVAETSIGRRSLSDRSPTPPPGVEMHRSRRSEGLLSEPMPALPPGVSISHADEQEEDDEVHRGTMAGHLIPERARNPSDMPSDGSAGSLLDFYGEEEESSTLLAAGSVSASGEKRKSIGNVEVAMAAVKSAAARVEVDEMQDGSLLWQVVRNLRISGTSDPSSPSVTGGFHSRHGSDASSIAPAPAAAGGLRAPLALPRRTPAKSADSADPMAFMMRRQRMRSNEEKAEARASLEGSDHSVQVFEADSSDVNALVDELVSNNEAGSFNLVRSQSVQRIIGTRSPPLPSTPDLL